MPCNGKRVSDDQDAGGFSWVGCCTAVRFAQDPLRRSPLVRDGGAVPAEYGSASGAL